MSVTLCLDFGNTRQKAAIFEEGRQVSTMTISVENTDGIEAVLNEWKPERSILSSVIEHPSGIEELLQNRTRFHLLSHESRLPFTTPVGKPATIGADRLALAAAAVYFYPEQNNLVIGLGSCVTYNFINFEHQFVGGSISPGLTMRLKAMHQFTAKLPMVEPHWNAPLLGYDTPSNLLSGAVIGLAKEIDGFIDAYQERYLNFNALLTGGDIVHLGSHLKNRIFADSDLIFKGLYAICQVNNP